MKTKREFCHTCRGHRDQAVMGFMPVMFTEGEAKATWKRTLVCSECGTINYESVTNQEVDRAQMRYLQTLVDLELETEETIMDRAGVEL